MVLRREFLTGLVGTGVSLGLTPYAQASVKPDLELILALDMSGSVFRKDNMERKSHWDVQIEGHLYALSHPDVRGMLLAGKTFLRLVTWSDSSAKVKSIFEQILDSEQVYKDAIACLYNIHGQNCYSEFCDSTEHYWLMGAINKFVPMGRRRVLDISTDEVPDTTSRTVLKGAREIFEGTGGTVNALGVKMDAESMNTLRLDLCSPHGFCIGAQKSGDYAEALLQKVRLEIA
jgi:hypothetical protein